jgi:hypothetical protein
MRIDRDDLAAPGRIHWPHDRGWSSDDLPETAGHRDAPPTQGPRVVNEIDVAATHGAAIRAALLTVC